MFVMNVKCESLFIRIANPIRSLARGIQQPSPGRDGVSLALTTSGEALAKRSRSSGTV
jgi:hypothetical protein